MKNHFRPNKCGVITIAAVAICISAAAVVIPRFATANSAPEFGRDEIVQNYIDFLAGAKSNAAMDNINWVHCVVPGMATDQSVLPKMTLEEAEQAGLLNSGTKVRGSNSDIVDKYNAIAIQQNNLVTSQFGVDAWENVAFTLEVADPVDGELGYRLRSTGDEITEEEYDKAVQEFWKDVAAKENVDYYDIFLEDGEPVENLEHKRVDIIEKYAPDLPVELTVVSDTEAYLVNLKFNGASESGDGYKDFHFMIDNRKGSWIVYEGLTWNEPVPEFPTGD
ncbi:hypothetical protein SDC9_51417 [bioreactor metagenome]|uniref:Uncharacterized protein n=1 Tax=bioreactor metagenome TaxID=1076179 RepID=A0A644WNN5_9ZZZZ|nr:hypothetical protein [Pseudoflavonifractor sp.]